MTREQVDALLRNTRTRTGRRGYLEIEISRIDRAIRAARNCVAADLAAPKVSRPDMMPRGGSGTDDPTQRIALALVDGSAEHMSAYGEEIEKLRAQKARLQAERREIDLMDRCAQAWLDGLTERERWVVEHHEIDGRVWEELLPKFDRHFDEPASLSRLKRMKKRAMEKIYRMAV